MIEKPNIKTQQKSDFNLGCLKLTDILEVRVANSGIVHTLIFQLNSKGIVVARETNGSFRPNFAIIGVKSFTVVRSRYLASKGNEIYISTKSQKENRGLFYLGYVREIILTRHNS